MPEYDALFKFFQESIPRGKSGPGKSGRPRADELKTFNGIMWVLRSGARWKDMPKEFGSYQTCHRRHQQWVEAGVYEDAYRRLLMLARKKGRLRMDECFIDASFSPAKKGQQCRAHKTRKRQQNPGHLRSKRPADFIGGNIRQST
jgi:transposase